MFLQRFDAGQNRRVLFQHLGRHIGQGDLLLDNLPLDRTLKNLRQTLHMRFSGRIACAHAVAEVEVLQQVRGEVNRLAVGTTTERNRADTAITPTRVGVDQMRAAQLKVRVVNRKRSLVQQAGGQAVVLSQRKPLLVRVVHKLRAGDLLAKVLIVIKKVATQSLDKLTQRRAERALLRRPFAVGKAHMRSRIADIQRPHIRHDIAPRCDLDLHAELGENCRHIRDRLFQRQVLAGNTRLRPRRRRQQHRLAVVVEILHRLDNKLRPVLHHAFDRTTIRRADNALAVPGADIRWQLNLDLKRLLIAIVRIDDIRL